MLAQFINLNLFAFLLVFSRVGATLMVLPGFSSQQVPVPVRLTFALMTSLAMTPMIMSMGVLPAEPALLSALFLLLASEILIGVFLGLIPRVLMAALQTAGTVLSFMASMANMFTMDPIAESQSSVLAVFLSMVALTLIFVTNTHHLFLLAIADSYSLFQPVDTPMIGDMTDYVARRVADSFRIGVQIASPLMVTAVAYYLGIGIMGRLMPQLPVFFFGMPIQIAMQITVIMIILPAMMMVFMSAMSNGIGGFTAPLTGMGG